MKDVNFVSTSEFEKSRFNTTKKKKSDTSIKQIFGHHLLLDLYKCDALAVTSLDQCYHYLDIMPDLMDVQKQSQPFVVCNENIGISGWVPIVESGVSLYTNVKNSFVSVDIYSCKEFDFEKVRSFTKNVFNPKDVQERYIFRGKEYVCPIV